MLRLTANAYFELKNMNTWPKKPVSCYAAFLCEEPVTTAILKEEIPYLPFHLT